MPNWVLFTFQLMLFPCLSAFLSVTGLVSNPLLSILAGAVIIVLYYYLMRNTINLDFARGIRQIKAGRYKAAIDSFKKSVAQYEKYPFLDKWRFIIFLSSSRYGFHEMALTNLAFAYIKSGELSSAKKCYEECLRINPDNQTAKNISSLIDISPREITEAG